MEEELLLVKMQLNGQNIKLGLEQEKYY